MARITSPRWRAASSAVFEERNRDGGDMSFLAFDLLTLDGQDVMREPWTARWKRLEDVCASFTLSRVGIVPVTDDAATLYETWAGWGGEGIVLKEPTSIYRSGNPFARMAGEAQGHA